MTYRLGLFCDLHPRAQWIRHLAHGASIRVCISATLVAMQAGTLVMMLLHSESPHADG